MRNITAIILDALHDDLTGSRKLVDYQNGEKGGHFPRHDGCQRCTSTRLPTTTQTKMPISFSS